ncbi:MAG TPA: hypothetical protein PLM98_07680, partial [Thiolinea sp.]|nr:hypothetical protein [Thiolinea sp.]
FLIPSLLILPRFFGVTGVTGVTLLILKDFFGYTMSFLGVTGVTILKSISYLIELSPVTPAA